MHTYITNTKVFVVFDDQISFADYIATVDQGENKNLSGFQHLCLTTPRTRMSLCWITKPPCKLSEGVRRHWLNTLYKTSWPKTKAVPLQGFILFFSFRGSGEHNGLESQENKVAFVAISKSLPHFLFHSHVVRWQFQSTFLYCSVALGTDK